MRHRSVVLVAVATSFVSLVSLDAFAATCTWQGTSSASWSVAANWSCGHAPIAIDDAVFPAGAGIQYAINQDVVPQATVNSVVVTGGAYTFSGKTLILKNGISSSSLLGPLFLLPLKLAQDASFTNTAGSGPMVFQTGGIDIGANSLQFTANAEIDALSVISGSGTITKAGSGLLVLDGVNTYTGPTTINAGTAQITRPESLGTADGATTVNGAGAILSVGNVTMAEPITFLSTGVATMLKNSGGGTLTWSGPITLGQTVTFANASANAFKVTGNIGGAGGLTVTGTSFEIASASNNFNAGFTAAVTGSVTVTGTANPFGSGPVTITNGSNISLFGIAAIPNSFHLLGAGPSAAQSPLRIATGTPTMNGLLILDAGASIDVSGGATLTLVGGAAGAGALTKRGSGALHLDSACTTTAGATIVNDGTLILDIGDVLPDDTNVTILKGAGLVGSAASETVGSISGAGTIDLGSGKLTFGNAASQTISGAISGAGALVKQGSGIVTLIGPSSFGGGLAITQGTIQLSTASLPSSVIASGGALGATPGATGSLTLDGATTFIARSDTKLTATGAVSLGNAKLDLAFTTEPTLGDTLLLIDNDGADPVTGTFAGLAEGAIFATSGLTVGISYKGGTGNDVVITVVEPTTDAGPTDAGATVDAGEDPNSSVDAGEDASSSDAGAVDGAPSEDAAMPPEPSASNDAAVATSPAESESAAPSDDGGCSVTNPTRNTSFFGPLLAAAVTLVALRRRRRES